MSGEASEHPRGGPMSLAPACRRTYPWERTSERARPFSGGSMNASGRLPSRARTRCQQRGDSPSATQLPPLPPLPPRLPLSPRSARRPLPLLSRLRPPGPLPLLLPLLALLSGLALGCSMFNTGMSEARDLQRVGVSAQAEILSIGETGLTVNDNPVITLDVEVRPADRPPYRATIKRLLVSRLEVPQFQPGRVIPVRFDPRDP